jgi:hypothetical protein
MHHSDYDIGARQHAARIRAEHEYEATELDATRRRTVELEAAHLRRASLVTGVLVRLRRRPLGVRYDGARGDTPPTRP